MFLLFLKKREREGVRGCGIGPDRRPTDDGKRLDSLSPRWMLHPGGWMPQPHTLIFLLFIFSKWGEVRRGEIAVAFEPIRGLADSYFELFASLFCIHFSNVFLEVSFLHF